jgi:hypothetical protein
VEGREHPALDRVRQHRQRDEGGQQEHQRVAEPRGLGHDPARGSAGAAAERDRQGRQTGGYQPDAHQGWGRVKSQGVRADRFSTPDPETRLALARCGWLWRWVWQLLRRRRVNRLCPPLGRTSPDPPQRLRAQVRLMLSTDVLPYALG